MNDRLVNNNPFIPDVPFYPNLLLRTPKQQPIKQNITQNIQEINPNPNINLDFEENTISRKHHVRDISKTGQVTFPKPKRIRRPYK